MSVLTRVMDSNGVEIIPNCFVQFVSKGRVTVGRVRYVKVIQENGSLTTSIYVQPEGVYRHPIVFHKPTSLTVI